MLPSVYVVHDPLRLSLGMDMVEVLLHSCDEMVLKRTFDELMKEIGGEKFVYVGVREITSEWLQTISMIFGRPAGEPKELTMTPLSSPQTVQSMSVSNWSYRCSVCSRRRGLLMESKSSG